MSMILSIVTSCVTAILSAILVGYLNHFKAIQKNQDLKEKSLNNLVLSQSRLFLKKEMERAIAQGYATTEDYETTQKLYKAYVDAGGNGLIKHMFLDVYKELPIKTE